MTSPLLQVEHITKRFGGLTAIEDVSFEVAGASITAVIGPNGAGKTTLFNCLTGFYRPDIGRFLMEGRHWLERMPPHAICAEAGVARTFQNIRLFPQMSVLENLLVGAHRRLQAAGGAGFGGLLGLPAYRRAEEAAITMARRWLERLGLIDRADEPAGSLPYGDQRLLEIARALCTEPKLLCLDEPAAGLNPQESEALASFLEELVADHGLGVLLIEHDMSLVMRVSEHIIVLDHGQKIAEGTPEAIRRDPHVIRAYLGEEEEDELPPEIAADLGHGEGRARP